MKNFIFAAILFLGANSFAIAPANTPVANAVTKDNGEELKVSVKGMVCSFCAQGITKKFKGMKEVASVEVSLEEKFVKLKFKDGQKISKEKVAEVLKDAGYEAQF